MNREKQQLIHDLFDDESQRQTVLLAGNRMLRRRRHWRVAGPVLTLLMMAIIVGALWLGQKNSSQSPIQASVTAAKPSTQTQARSLTDDELLALFPHTPVGLVTLSNGKKLLIFPRPGDERQFISRM